MLRLWVQMRDILVAIRMRVCFMFAPFIYFDGFLERLCILYLSFSGICFFLCVLLLFCIVFLVFFFLYFCRFCLVFVFCFYGLVGAL